MTTKVYKTTPPMARQEAESAFSSGSPEQIADALVRVAFNDPDWRWVQEKCLTFLDNPTSDVRRLAVTCLGHLARIHGEIDRERVLPLLNILRKDDEVSGTVEDTLEDIEAFTGS
jgi:hypothetical protein